MPIRCIAFDLDDTLWACKPVIARAEQRFYAWLDAHYPRITARYTPAELIAERVSYMQQYPELHYNLTQLRKNWLAVLAQSNNYPKDNLVTAGFNVFWLARNEVEFYAGTLDVLHALRQSFVLGVITNGNANVHHIGVGHLFQFVLSAAEAGVAKPHPAIFQQALAMVDVAPQEAVYVGDDPLRDMHGAASAGLRTIWFNPAKQPWQGEKEPDATLTTLAELEMLIPLL